MVAVLKNGVTKAFCFKKAEKKEYFVYSINYLLIFALD